jgi:ribonuclease E
MSKIMLINVLQPEECRIAILENGVLEELYVERTSLESYVGNIYKGRIVNIEPSIQAAFVDFGVGRNGFLHVSDVEPTYYRHLESPRPEGRQRDDRRPRRDDRPRGDDRRPRREYREDIAVPRGREDVAMPHEQFEEDVPPPRYETEPPPEGPRRRFGADLMDEFEEMPPSHTEARPADHAPIEEEPVFEEPPFEHVPFEEPAPVEVEPVAEAPAEPVVETPVEAEAPEEKPRKRTTRKKKDAPKPKRTSTRKKKASAESEEPPQPEVMDSAERRTDDGDESHTPLNPDINPEDEGLSFRRSRPTHHQPETRPSAYPEEQTERFSPEPETGEHEQVELEAGPQEFVEEETAPVEEFRGPRSRRDEGRRGGHRRPMSIEEELEADLRAAEVESVHTEFVRPTLEDESQAAAPPEDVTLEHEPVEELQGWVEEPVAVEVEQEEFDEFAPPPRPRERDDRGRRGERDRGERDRGGRDRGDRGRDRDRGRGDRGDRGDRGERRGGRDRDRGERRGSGPRGGRDGNGRPKPLIQDIFKRGQEVIVQVIKEHLGTKGPTLSTYISIPGRYLVLMPGLNRVGVSRKIEDEDQRRRLKDIFSRLKPPRGVGFIIRTAGEDKTEKELQSDLAYLSRLWQVVVRRLRKQKSPAEIYQESDMITRHIRDTFTGDIDKVIIDEPQAFEHAQEFLQIVMPKYADRIELYNGVEPLFHKYGIEKELDRIHLKKVPLPNGGSIVIEQTEALVAIDVNSGNFRANGNAEETAYQINLQAAKEIARQLRLRDLAGVIVNDFIDMREEGHRRNVERALRDAVARDRSRIKILRMSQFGIIEMTRQRVRTSLKRSVFQECHHCSGTGHVKTPESMSLDVMRAVQLAACREYVKRVEVNVSESVANYLHNRKRKELSQLEQTGNMSVQITGQLGAPPETLTLTCYDNNNNEVKLHPVDDRRPQRR